MYRNGQPLPMRMSKNRIYENPCNIIGIAKLAGSEQKPKGICKDKIIGTRKGIESLEEG